MTRLIDADALEKEFCHGCQYENNKYVNCIDCAVANAPTVDAVKVVRCGQCKHFGTPKCTSDDMDWYCADGEMRERDE